MAEHFGLTKNVLRPPFTSIKRFQYIQPLSTHPEIRNSLHRINREDGNNPEDNAAATAIQNVRILHSKCTDAQIRYGISGDSKKDKRKESSELFEPATAPSNFVGYPSSNSREPPISDSNGWVNPSELAKQRFQREKDGINMEPDLGLAEDGKTNPWAYPRTFSEPVPAIRSTPQTRVVRKKSAAHIDSPPAFIPPWSVVFVTLVACGVAFFSALTIAMNRKESVDNPAIGRPQMGPQPSLPFGEARERRQLFGHFQVDEAPLDDLVPVLGDNSVYLRTAAAKSFLEMQRAAWDEGVYLIPLSGFRSIKDQENIFYSLKAERNQRLEERAKVSAPPGFSEHHSGYAVDIGDVMSAHTHLEFDFENTDAFFWLVRNANRFHFEMSFPRNNDQGIAYEPWHWRFVGDMDSVHIFYGREM